MDLLLAFWFVTPAVLIALVTLGRRFRMWRELPRERALSPGEARLVFTPDTARAALELAAKELDLTFRSTGFVIELVGRIEEFEVRAQHCVYGDGEKITKYSLRVELRAPRVLPEEIEIGGSVDPRRKIRTGDEAFDALVGVCGRPIICLAMLDEATRLALRRTSDDITLRRGALVLKHEERPLSTRSMSTAQGIGAVVRRAIELAGLLRNAEDLSTIPARLAMIGAIDGCREMRRQALRELDRSYVAHPVREEALARALDDRDPAIRLFAAVRLGVAGPDFLQQIFASLPAPESLAVIQEVIELRVVAAAPLCVRIAVDRAQSAENRAAAAFAVELLAGPEAIAPLLAVLESREVLPAELRAAIQSAIKAIGERGGESARGRLSIGSLDGGAGAVSIAPAGRGALSEPEE